MSEIIFTEATPNALTVMGDNEQGPWRVRGIGLTIGEVNSNNRLYTMAAAEDAVNRAKGRLVQEAKNRPVLTGEVDHPNEKKTQQPLLGATVFHWTDINIEGKQIIVEGLLLGTQAGRDLRAMNKAGMPIGLSQRAKGDSRRAGGGIEEVTRFDILGYDAVLSASDRSASIKFLESNQQQTQKELNMSDLIQQINQFIEAQVGTYTRFDETTRATIVRNVRQGKPESFDEARTLIESRVRDFDLVLEKARADNKERLERLERENAALNEAQSKAKVATYLETKVKDLEYPEDVAKAMLESLQAASSKTEAEADTLLESQRKIFDPLAANAALAGRGYKRVEVKGPVIEQETGYKAFARVSFEMDKHLHESRQGVLFDPRSPKTQGERIAVKLLEEYDRRFGMQLRQEAELYEAEQTSDLSIPFSAVRSVVAQVYPMLLAAQVFDFQPAMRDPEHIGYEVFTAEEGLEKEVEDEEIDSGSFANGQSEWIQLPDKALEVGTVVVKTAGESVIADDGTNYVVDHAKGWIKFLDGGSDDNDVTEDTAYLVSYTSFQISKGENQPIERAKLQIVWRPLSSEPFRLATNITREAIIYGRAQASWDAQGRTLAALSKEVRKRLDSWIFYLARSAALTVPNNTIPLEIDENTEPDDIVAAIGQAKVLVINRHYEPTAVVMSAAISDLVSNSDLFSAAGSKPDSQLETGGFVGRVKGLPSYEAPSSVVPDNTILTVNRELVMHRTFVPPMLHGPFPTYDPTTGKMIAAENWYLESFEGSDAPVPEKGSLVLISEG